MTQLQRCIGRIERLLARGTATSSRFTRWRLAIFIGGLVTSITLFKLSWYNSGNLAIAGFVILFLIVVTPLIHDFWKIPDPAQRLGEMVNFTKNAALMGAAMMMLLLPRPWPYSV